MAELDGDSLSAGEQAYFDSQGQTPVEIKDDPPATEGAAEGGEPDAQAEADGAPGGQPPERERTKMVPHQALHEAREEAKQLRESNRRFEETVNQRLALLAQNQAPKGEPKAPDLPPDPTLDPLAAIQHDRARLEQLAKQLEERDRSHQETTVRSQVTQFSQADEQNARSQAPDFDAAKNHLLMSRGRELFVASGGQATDAQIRHQLAAEEEQLRITAIQRGQRPSVALYYMAIARGYTPKQAATAAGDGDERIAALADAQRDNKTLSLAGGGAADGPMTAKRLADMSPEDFASYSEKNGKTVRKLMGA